MSNQERVSIKNRRKWRITRKTLFLIFLLVVVAILLAIRVYIKSREPDPGPSLAGQGAPPANLSDLCDSIVVKAYDSFNLDELIHGDAASRSAQTGSGAYSLFYQGWPAELPFLIFAQRLAEMAADRNMLCDCFESQSGGWMECDLKAGHSLGAKIRLKSSPDVDLVERELTVALENFGGLKIEQINSLLKSGMAFSYIARADAYPTGKVKELLNKKGITAILELPSTAQGWQKLIELGRLGKQAKGRTSKVKFGSAIIDEALERHPAAKLFFFAGAQEFDKNIVKAVAERARRKKLGYLHTPDQVPELASLVSQSGLKIYKASKPSRLDGIPLWRLRNELLKDLISGNLDPQTIVCPSTEGMELAELWEFKVFFEKLGVKFRPVMGLVKSMHYTIGSR